MDFSCRAVVFVLVLCCCLFFWLGLCYEGLAIYGLFVAHASFGFVAFVVGLCCVVCLVCCFVFVFCLFVNNVTL